MPQTFPVRDIISTLRAGQTRQRHRWPDGTGHEEERESGFAAFVTLSTVQLWTPTALLTKPHSKCLMQVQGTPSFLSPTGNCTPRKPRTQFVPVCLGQLPVPTTSTKSVSAFLKRVPDLFLQTQILAVRYPGFKVSSSFSAAASQLLPSSAPH